MKGLLFVLLNYVTPQLGMFFSKELEKYVFQDGSSYCNIELTLDKTVGLIVTIVEVKNSFPLILLDARNDITLSSISPDQNKEFINYLRTLLKTKGIVQNPSETIFLAEKDLISEIIERFENIKGG